MSVLTGIKVVEFVGLAPGPFAGLILADWGASVVRVDKPDQETADIMGRGKRTISISPKIPSGRAALRKLIAEADVLIDPFRPGILEKLGLGPDVFLNDKDGVNKRLVYARLSGFSRTGPTKNMAGHDLNYLAQSGVLSLLPPASEEGRPSFPNNILADLAGGGMTCALGILLALYERTNSGRGQLVHTDMVTGTRYISTFALLHASYPSSHMITGPPGTNLLDGGFPYYGVYRCKDGLWITVGAVEPQFNLLFLDLLDKALPLDFTPPDRNFKPKLEDRFDRSTWPQTRAYLEAAFLLRTRDEWAATYADTDSCVMPVLNHKEAAAVSPTGSLIPAPHPDLSRTNWKPIPRAMSELNPPAGAHTIEVLREIGLDESDIRALQHDGALGQSHQAKL